MWIVSKGMGNEKADLNLMAEDVRGAWHRYLDVFEPPGIAAPSLETPGMPGSRELGVAWRSNGYRYRPRAE